MQRVKLFKGVETDCAGLEQQVNAWLEESGAKIIHIFGNIAPQTVTPTTRGTSTRAFDASDLFLAIVYETR